jgi:hypothetical protein
MLPELGEMAVVVINLDPRSGGTDGLTLEMKFSCSDTEATIIGSTISIGYKPVCRIIKRIFAVLVFGALVFPASAQDAKVSVDMIGIGSMSCAHWRSTKEYLLEGTVWIYGFWTGLNYVAAATDQAQAKVGVPTIVAEVQKTCAKQMSQTLANAVWTTYIGSKR